MFGAEVRTALVGDGAAAGTVIYTRNVRNLTGGLFYAGFPVYRLTPADGIPPGAEPLYLLSGDFPQSGEYSWENLFPKDFTYNDHPLNLYVYLTHLIRPYNYNNHLIPLHRYDKLSSDHLA